jgi:PAS domain S-box-containing protein
MNEPDLANLPRDVLDRLIEGCQVIGFDWTYLYVNDALVAQGRLPREALLGRTMMACYPGIDATPMFAHLRRCMTERVDERMENAFTFPDGSQICFELRFVPVPQGACILSLDITERRHRLAAIVNDSDDAIIGRDLDGTVTSWNRSAERMFGYAAEEMIGRPISLLFAPDHAGEEAAIAARLVEGERIDHFETVRIAKDGRVIDVSVTLSPVRDPAGTIIGVSTIARDIGELKQVRRALERARDSAESANRELESFSYSVAHDLRAPLRSIDGFSQALLEDCGDRLDDDGRRYLRHVRESAQLMAQLIDDMLTLSRVARSELDRRPVDLSSLARAASVRLARAHPGRDVAVVIEDGLAAEGDARLLAVVLDNLLGNAWKFTAKRAAARIEVGAVASGGGRAFFVRDDGAGFDMAYVGKLFGVFQRLHPASEFEGTGVGLATVQRVVHRHGGRVWAEGVVGGGATFYFTLGDEEPTA